MNIHLFTLLKRLKATVTHEKYLWKSVVFSKVAGHTKNNTLPQLLFTHFDVVLKTFCVELEQVNVHWEVVILQNTFLKSFVLEYFQIHVLKTHFILSRWFILITLL